MSKSISPETVIGPYRVVSQIGEGGMGQVYLAEDSRLHRKVALKILPSEMAANQDRMRRFKQEATAAAALNHPNIAHIYEIGESDGTNFIAMEFVEGVTLREELHRGQTELRKLLRYLQHVVEGLAKAHAAGIVHRDLKPDNIMITRDGHAKILDLGLAKLIEPQPHPARARSFLSGATRSQIKQKSNKQGVSMSNLESVRGIYEAFAKGDVPTVLGFLDADIAWTEAEGFPYGGTYNGPNAVLAGVFKRLGSEWDGFAAVPDEFIDAGDTIVVLGQYSGTYKSTGKSFKANFAHVWKIREGKAVRFVQYVDTLLVHRALQA